MNLKHTAQRRVKSSPLSNGILCAAAGLLLILSGSAAGAPVPPSVTVTDRYGEPLRVYLAGDGNDCRPVALADISRWLPLATIAIEDKRFYEHGGVDFQAIARAAWQNISSGRRVSGASTLTQQLAKAMDPQPRTMLGKMREAYDAMRLEHRLTKDQILEQYLNAAPYGNLTKGAEAAARFYFGVPAKSLTAGQAAMLAAIPKSPVRFDPLRHPAAVMTRRRQVLDKMLALKFIKAADYRLALKEKYRFAADSRPFLAPHFSDFAVSRMPAPLRQIRTTIDADIQRYAEAAIAGHIARLGYAHVTNAAAIVIDNRTGGILAWVGSADYFNDADSGKVDGVTMLRQPGSALKPFAYAMAFAHGASPADIIKDEPYYFQDGFAPRNYDESYHGSISLRQALACSYNIPAVRVTERYGGAEGLLSVLHKFGFESLDLDAKTYGLGLVLGNGEVRLVELASAYAALARGGLYAPLRFAYGGSYLYGEGKPRRVLGRQSAYLVTDILSDNAARAPAFGLNSPFHLPFAFAAKTGTSKDYRDNWAAGYTPRWTVAVWAGNFDGSSMRKVSGITGAGPILRDIASYMYTRYPSGEFTVPDGITAAVICPESGKLATPDCPSAVREVYASGRAPLAYCTLHGAETAAKPESARLKIAFPKTGDVFKVDSETPPAAQALNLRSESGSCRWLMDGTEIGEGEKAWWQLTAGGHRLECLPPEGSARQSANPVRFTVLK